MKFTHMCTRYNNGICRLTGYSCNIKRSRNEPHAYAAMREIVCYWFTRDEKEGMRTVEQK